MNKRQKKKMLYASLEKAMEEYIQEFTAASKSEDAKYLNSIIACVKQ